MERIPHRIFTAEFKHEPIKLVTEYGLVGGSQQKVRRCHPKPDQQAHS